MLTKVELPPRVGSPPKEMPADMVSDYLMNNQAHLRLWYDQRMPYHGSTAPHDWSIEVVEQFMSRAKNGERFDYSPAETATIYNALTDYPVAEMAGLVVGSIRPWVEAILLVAGQPRPVLAARSSCSDYLTYRGADKGTCFDQCALGQARRA